MYTLPKMYVPKSLKTSISSKIYLHVGNFPSLDITVEITKTTYDNIPRFWPTIERAFTTFQAVMLGGTRRAVNSHSFIQQLSIENHEYVQDLMLLCLEVLKNSHFGWNWAQLKRKFSIQVRKFESYIFELSLILALFNHHVGLT